MAKVLVAYASELGGTRGIAEAIGEGLARRGHEAAVRSVSDVDGMEDVSVYDAFVLGSGVFAGHWHKPAVEFASRHEAALAARPVWLFSSGPVGEMKIPGPITDPKEIAGLRRRLQPRDHENFWGSLDRSTLDASGLSAVNRFISKRFIPEGDWRDWPAIDAWSAGIANALPAFAGTSRG